MSDGIYLGGMIRNHRIAEANAQAADEASAQARAWAAHAKKLEGKNSELQARIAELEGQLIAAQMHAAGRGDVIAAFAEQHPNSPLLADSSQRFKDGDVKTKARRIYEQAFDAKGRELGLANPAQYRQD